MSALKQIEIYLAQRQTDLNEDLMARILPHLPNLELQVNVFKGDGEPLENYRNTFVNGTDRWHAVRIPRDAHTDEAHYEDRGLSFSLEEHADSVGSTGWLWKKKRSLFVAYDFDSIVGHAAGVGVSDLQLEQVKAAVSNIPWVEVRTSTGGKGLHLYVWIDPELDIEVNNHNEHAALARSILTQISSAAEGKIDIAKSLDVCGGNFWLASRRASESLGSYKLIKSASENFTAIDENWRQHVDIITRKKHNISYGGNKGDEDFFTRITSSTSNVELDDTHKKIIDECAVRGVASWNQSLNCLTTHTAILAQVAEEVDWVQGVFKTISPGTDLQTPNVFGYPLAGGGFRFYRFGKGTNEAPTWKTPDGGFCSCDFNVLPTVEEACLGTGGKRTKKGWVFASARNAVPTIQTLLNNDQFDMDLTKKMLTRQCTLIEGTEQLIVEIPSEPGDGERSQWNTVDRKGYLTRVIPLSAAARVDLTEYDQLVRATINPGGQQASYRILQKDGKSWTRTHSLATAKLALVKHAGTSKGTDLILGNAITNAWQLTAKPFAPEFPGDRVWNEAPQLAFQPELIVDSEDPNKDQHPTWTMILTHIGKYLDTPLATNEWAVKSAIYTGHDYLLAWLACMFQYPERPLSYLALIGGQNVGKSILGESIALLIDGGGVVGVDNLLQQKSQFNGVLEGAVLCTIEETNLGSSDSAMEKIKAWVTAPTIQVRKMYSEAIRVQNYCHFIQTANSVSALPKFGNNDSRITVIEVSRPARDIPKGKLFERLIAEGPAFTHTLLNHKLPTAGGRLQVPVVETPLRQSIAELNETQVETFIRKHCILDVNLRTFLDDFRLGLNSSMAADTKNPDLKRELNSSMNLTGVQVRRSTGNRDVIFGLGLKLAPTNLTETN